MLALQPRADAEDVEARAHCKALRRLGDDGDALARRVDEARGGGERRARRRERPGLDVGVLGALQRVDELELVRLARLHVADAEDRRGVVVAVGPQEDRVGQQQQRLGAYCCFDAPEDGELLGAPRAARTAAERRVQEVGVARRRGVQLLHYWLQRAEPAERS